VPFQRALKVGRRHNVDVGFVRRLREEIDARRRITLMPDYGVDWPIWGHRGPLREEELTVSDALKYRIKAWFNAWEVDAARGDWPTWTPPDGVSDDGAEEAWTAEGAEIARLLAIEMGDEYTVVYAP
jgi:hypothetical protein